MTYSLVPFKPCPFIDNFVAEFSAGQHVECEWRLDGNTDAIRWPGVTETSSRKHELWKTTCFEWFYGAADDEGYFEFNLSPSQDWNAYAFTGLREGMTEADGILPLAITTHRTDHEVLIQANIALPREAPSPAYLGLSAVIEDNEGNLHHFALAHTTPKPDFHARDNHVLIGEAR